MVIVITTRDKPNITFNNLSSLVPCGDGWLGSSNNYQIFVNVSDPAGIKSIRGYGTNISYLYGINASPDWGTTPAVGRYIINLSCAAGSWMSNNVIVVATNNFGVAATNSQMYIVDRKAPWCLYSCSGGSISITPGDTPLNNVTGTLHVFQTLTSNYVSPEGGG